ncbi:hypothetical protein H1R20_g4985, partial [Candolleomyces eurysporus]
MASAFLEPSPTSLNLLQPPSTSFNLLQPPSTSPNLLRPPPVSFNLPQPPPTFSNLLRPLINALDLWLPAQRPPPTSSNRLSHQSNIGHVAPSSQNTRNWLCTIYAVSQPLATPLLDPGANPEPRCSIAACQHDYKHALPLLRPPPATHQHRPAPSSSAVDMPSA